MMGVLSFQGKVGARKPGPWKKAAAWRNLTILALLLTVAAAGSFALSRPTVIFPRTALLAGSTTNGEKQAVVDLTSANKAEVIDPQVGAILALSGAPTKINRDWRWDAKGHDWPVSIAVISPPAHGKIYTNNITAPILSDRGVNRISLVTDIYYQSEPGYSGVDGVTYKRISNDPGDYYDGNVITLKIAVR